MIIFEIPLIKKKYRINRYSLIIGSIAPDLIDKTFLFLNLFSGRSFSHTLLFVLVSFSILFLITKGNKSISFPYLIGVIIHLILDLPEIPLFYPFVSYDFYDYAPIEDSISLWIHTLLTEPIVITTEIIGVMIFIFIVINNKLYNLREISNYLKTNEVLPNKEKNYINQQEN